MAATSKKTGRRRPPEGWVRRLTVVLIAAGLGAGLWLWVQASRHSRERDTGLRLAQESRFVDAEPILARAFARDAADVEVVKALARIALDTQQLEQANDYLARWCELQPHETEPFQLRAAFSERLGKIDQAVDDCAHLLQLAPQDTTLKNQVIVIFIANGRHAEAERLCRQVLIDNPNASKVLYFLAEACHGQGKDDEARQLLERILTRQPGDLDAQMLRAILDRDAGHDDRAIPVLRQVLARNPALQPVRYHLSLALARTGKTAEANIEIAEFIKQQEADRLVFDSRFQPNNLELQTKAAEALWSCGRQDEARNMLRTILRRDPQFAPAKRLQRMIQETPRSGGQ